MARPDRATSNAEDWVLISRYTNDGDEQAFALLVKKYTPRVRAVLARFYYKTPAGERDDLLDDLMQETWWRVFRYRFNLDHDSSFMSWLFTVAVNVSHNHMRNQKRYRRVHERLPYYENEEGNEVPMDAEDMSLEAQPDKLFEHNEAMRRALDAIDDCPTLNDEQRTILLMRAVEGQQYDEIAESLGISVNTVKTRIFRGRVRLQRLFQELHNDL